LNIVFDLGGVVFNWHPDKLIRGVFDDEETRTIVKSEILEHPDWLELDRGTLPFRDAVVRGADRTGLPNTDIERLLNEVPRSLTPIHETIELIRSMVSPDHRLFVLSNMHFASIAYLEKEHDIWDMFDGTVISCRIQKIKPEIGIYEYLLNEYQLVASETVFIDDMSENLAAARSIGIQTIKFLNSSQCRQDLTELVK
jgi:putative hydrolase of the HAD superfamily